MVSFELAAGWLACLACKRDHNVLCLLSFDLNINCYEQTVVENTKHSGYDRQRNTTDSVLQKARWP